MAECKGPGFIVFSERSSHGWTAEIDGVSVPVARAYGLVLGVDVPAGRSTISLSYKPPGFRLGAFISGALLFLLAGLAIGKGSGSGYIVARS